MKKHELLKLLRHLPQNAIIGFIAFDFDPDAEGAIAEVLSTGRDVPPHSYLKKNQGVDFVLT